MLIMQSNIANGSDYAEKQHFIAEFALSNSVIVLIVSVVVSMEINRRQYFQSKLRILREMLYKREEVCT